MKTRLMMALAAGAGGGDGAGRGIGWGWQRPGSLAGRPLCACKLSADEAQDIAQVIHQALEGVDRPVQFKGVRPIWLP